MQIKRESRCLIINKQNSNINRYNSINGLRVLACFGIVIMHVKANVNYSLNGYWPKLIISEFSNFVFLFMIISSFGMCCGYYNKIKNNEISPEKFYSKRILKFLPFFLSLLLLNILVDHNIPSLIEAFANSTLMFGLLQKDIEVLGVSWFLGLVVVFYFLFPFFTFLFSSKKKAWITTIIAFLMNYSCVYYFNVGRKNMFYSFIYFCIGGLVYLYKEKIIDFFKNNRIIGIIFIILSLVIYFVLPLKNGYFALIRYLLLSVTLLFYAISYESKLLNNSFTKFIGNISLEIYLCHMVIFRIVEKLHLTNLFSNNWVSYIFTCVLVLFGSIYVSYCFQLAFKFLKNKIN